MNRISDELARDLREALDQHRTLSKQAAEAPFGPERRALQEEIEGLAEPIARMLVAASKELGGDEDLLRAKRIFYRGNVYYASGPRYFHVDEYDAVSIDLPDTTGDTGP